MYYCHCGVGFSTQNALNGHKSAHRKRKRDEDQDAACDSDDDEAADSIKSGGGGGDDTPSSESSSRSSGGDDSEASSNSASDVGGDGGGDNDDEASSSESSGGGDGGGGGGGSSSSGSEGYEVGGGGGNPMPPAKLSELKAQLSTDLLILEALQPLNNDRYRRSVALFNRLIAEGKMTPGVRLRGRPAIYRSLEKISSLEASTMRKYFVDVDDMPQREVFSWRANLREIVESDVRASLNLTDGSAHGEKRRVRMFPEHSANFRVGTDVAGDLADAGAVRDRCRHVVDAVKARPDYDGYANEAARDGKSLSVWPYPLVIFEDAALRKKQSLQPVYAAGAMWPCSERNQRVHFLGLIERVGPPPDGWGGSKPELSFRRSELFHTALGHIVNSQVRDAWRGPPLFVDSADGTERFWVVYFWGVSNGDTPGLAEVYRRLWQKSCLYCVIPGGELHLSDPQFVERDYQADAFLVAHLQALTKEKAATGLDTEMEAARVDLEAEATVRRLYTGLLPAPARGQGIPGLAMPEPATDIVHSHFIGMSNTLRKMCVKLARLKRDDNAVSTLDLRGTVVPRYSDTWRDYSPGWAGAATLLGGDALGTIRVLIAAVGADTRVYKRKLAIQVMRVLERFLLVVALENVMPRTQPQEDELVAAGVAFRRLAQLVFQGLSPSEFNFPNFHLTSCLSRRAQ